MESYNLIFPIQKRVNEIKESLFAKQLLEAGDERLIYGTFEKTFENYCTESLRDGNRVNEIDYYNNSIKELEQIEEAILQMETLIHADKKNSVHFHSIFKDIHNVKNIAKEEIQKLNDKIVISKNIAKPRNIKSKLTYDWVGNKKKIRLFKKLLIENNLIEKSISLDDFEFIFSKQPITLLKMPIFWTNDNATQLIYLIKALKQNKIIHASKNNFDYIQLCECFHRANKEKFNPKKLKPLLFEIDINISSEFKEVLEQIIKELQK